MYCTHLETFCSHDFVWVLRLVLFCALIYLPKAGLSPAILPLQRIKNNASEPYYIIIDANMYIQVTTWASQSWTQTQQRPLPENNLCPTSCVHLLKKKKQRQKKNNCPKFSRQHMLISVMYVTMDLACTRYFWHSRRFPWEAKNARPQTLWTGVLWTDPGCLCMTNETRPPPTHRRANDRLPKITLPTRNGKWRGEAGIACGQSVGDCDEDVSFLFWSLCQGMLLV